MSYSFCFLHVAHRETHTKEVVEPRKRLQEDVSSFVGKLVASGDEEVEGLLQVEVQVPAGGTIGKQDEAVSCHPHDTLEKSIQED